MILEDVDLVEVVQDGKQGPPYYRSRTMKITTDIGSFTTPARVTTRTEYVARSSVPLSTTVPLELALDFRELDNDQVQNFNNGDGEVANTFVGYTNQFNDITSNAILRLSIFQPPETMLNTMSSKEKIDFANAQAEYLQSRLGSTLITYPFLGLPVSEYKQFIDTHYRRDEHNSTIFTLDMSMDSNHLRAMIDYIIQKEQPAIIALIYREWRKSIPQHRVINSYLYNKKTAFFACQVEREEPQNHINNLHSVTFGGGFDMASLAQIRGHGNSGKLDLSKIKFFDPTSLRLGNIENTLGDPARDIVAELNFPPENVSDIEYVKKVLKGYRGAKVHPKKYETLFYLTRTHESITSTNVFKLLREKMEKKQIKDYLDNTSLKFAPMVISV